ncbi:hypothetical protein ONZ45_g3901 [Pleurotus djamor]|nr:hypothetical protein ONZ45_g3901 [Pleurotus djamor]
MRRWLPSNYLRPLHQPSPPKQAEMPKDTPSSQPAFDSRCPHSNTARNLVVCIDGTANQFSAKSTNIIELFSRLVKDEEDQLAFYNSGIGTYAKPSFQSLGYLKQVVYHSIDMAIAWNFERIIHAAYEWLSENYRPGDRIFLFGGSFCFSRGAYQVRVVAGMIHKVGLLHKGNKNQIPFAYELYSSVTENTKRDPTKEGSPNQSNSGASLEAEHKHCQQFKATLCRKDVKVHFVGAWDTVSSIGILRGKSLPETVSGMGHVCAFRHALALDELRAKFQPEYANGGLGPLQGDVGDVKEVWFAGSHSDIGGGNISNENLSNFGPALRWMTYEAMTRGLRMNPYEGQWSTIAPKESLKGIWFLLELLPFPSLSYESQDSLTWWPHLASRRVIHPGQYIHQSVFTHLERTGAFTSKSGINKSSIDTDSHALLYHDPTSLIPGSFPSATIPTSTTYVPEAILPSTRLSARLNWKDLLRDYTSHPIVEKDPYENVMHTVSTLDGICRELLRERDPEDDDPLDFNTFTAAILTLRSYLDDAARLSSIAEVPRAAYSMLTALHIAHEKHRSDIESRRTLLRLLTHARSLPQGRRRRFTTAQIKEWVEPFGDEFKLSLNNLLTSFGNPCLHSHLVKKDSMDDSFCFSSNDPHRIFILHRNSHIDVWDTSSGQPPRDYMAYPDLQIARATRDSSLIATARSTNPDHPDKIGIRIFDTKTHRDLRESAEILAGATLSPRCAQAAEDGMRDYDLDEDERGPEEEKDYEPELGTDNNEYDDDAKSDISDDQDGDDDTQDDSDGNQDDGDDNQDDENDNQDDENDDQEEFDEDADEDEAEGEEETRGASVNDDDDDGNWGRGIAMCFSNDNQMLAISSGTSVVLWRRDEEGGWQAFDRFRIGGWVSTENNAITFLADNSKIAYMTREDVLATTLDHSNYETVTLIGSRYPRAIVTSADGKWLVSLHTHGYLKIYSVDDLGVAGQTMNTGDPHTRCVAFRPDGKVLATGGKGIQLWRCDTWERVYQYRSGPMDDFAFSPDGMKMATANLEDDSDDEDDEEGDVEEPGEEDDGIYASRPMVQLWDIEAAVNIHFDE